MNKLEGQGRPTIYTKANKGDIYTDTNTGIKYECLGPDGFVGAGDIEKNKYDWKEIKSAGGGGGGGLDVIAEVGQVLLASEIDENGKVAKWQPVLLNAKDLVCLTTLDADLLNAGDAYPSIAPANGIIIPEGTTFIGIDAFDNMEIKEVRINASNPTFETATVESKKGLSYVSPFSDNYNLLEVTINGSISEINDGLFSGCGRLKKITINDTTALTKIGVSAFESCALSDLSGVSLWGINEIGEGAFKYCSELESISPIAVTEFKDYVFCGCSKLKSVGMSLGVTSVGNYTFAGCGFEDFRFGHTNDNPYYESGELKTIGDYAFQGCANLKKIFLPSSIESMGVGVFDYCSDELVIEGWAGTYVETYAKENGVTFAPIEIIVEIPEGTTAIDQEYDYDHRVTKLILPDSLTEIGSHAFSNCTKLTSVDLPPALETIMYNAFGGCILLKEISFPNGLEFIGEHAFGNCASLAKAIIPTSVTFISENAFGGCSETFEIHGYADSYAETYATENGITFVAIEE